MSQFRTIRVSDPRFEHDGLRIITVKSRALKQRGDITLFLPEVSTGPIPLILLLHGVYGSHWSWSMGGGAHRTASRLIKAGIIRPMALAMPSDGLWGDGSGYLTHHGVDYESWIIDEVPAAVREVTDLVTSTSPLFISGLSMGGFGALRLGGKYADRFTGISAHSAITHLNQMGPFVEEDFDAIDASPIDADAAFALQSNASQLPPLRFDCGTEDQLLAANRALHEALLAADLPHSYEEFAGGHSWPYWEKHLEDTLRFFETIHSSPPGQEGSAA